MIQIVNYQIYEIILIAQKLGIALLKMPLKAKENHPPSGKCAG
jgi:hypothetical protein